MWQNGHGSEEIWGIAATGAIASWIPLMIFAFLYGLSMDYEVFILARIREEYDKTGDTDEAVVFGLGRTGRLVTSAALILFLAFEVGFLGMGALWFVYLMAALFFYYADAFNADRRNNAMFFWKSMPLSDFKILSSKMLAGLTIFPALIFGWLRIRSGSLLAPVLYHALCNLGMYVLQRSYV